MKKVSDAVFIALLQCVLIPTAFVAGMIDGWMGGTLFEQSPGLRDLLLKRRGRI